MDEPATGSFGHDRWHIEQPAGDPRSTRFASAHESHHKQLQDSTSFGALARVYHDLGRATGVTRLLGLADELTAAGREVHESFATWLPAAALGWTREEVATRYPAYGPFYDMTADLVGAIASPYAAFHAAHAMARACLQTGIIEVALDTGLRNFSLGHVRHRDLPDQRFRLLRRRPPDWSKALDRLERHAGEAGPSAVRLSRLLAAQTLTAELFDPAHEQEWELVNLAMYEAAGRRLAEFGTATLEQDGHLAWTPKLVAAARDISADFGLAAGHRRRQSEISQIVLGTIESEEFSVAAPLPARLMPPGTPASAMIADVERPHLFVTVRSAAQLFANYTLPDGEPVPATTAGAFARRTVDEGDGQRVVELLALSSEPALIDAVGVPVVTVTAMSLLTDPAVAAWTGGESLSRSALLVDIPLGPNLSVWLDAAGSRFSYVFLRVESFHRVVPFLVGLVEVDGAPALPLLLRPLSHAGVRLHKAALAELDPAAVREDGAFLPRYAELLELCLAHLAGEEVRFGASPAR